MKIIYNEKEYEMIEPEVYVKVITEMINKANTLEDLEKLRKITIGKTGVITLLQKELGILIKKDNHVAPLPFV